MKNLEDRTVVLLRDAENGFIEKRLLGLYGYCLGKTISIRETELLADTAIRPGKYKVTSIRIIDPELLFEDKINGLCFYYVFDRISEL